MSRCEGVSTGNLIPFCLPCAVRSLILFPIDDAGLPIPDAPKCDLGFDWPMADCDLYVDCAKGCLIIEPMLFVEPCDVFREEVDEAYREYADDPLEAFRAADIEVAVYEAL